MTGVRAPSCAAVLREDLRWPFRSLESPPLPLSESRAGWSRNRLDSRRSRILVFGFFLVFWFSGFWFSGCLGIRGFYFRFCLVVVVLVLYGAVVSVSRSCVLISLSVGFSFFRSRVFSFFGCLCASLPLLFQFSEGFL